MTIAVVEGQCLGHAKGLSHGFWLGVDLILFFPTLHKQQPRNHIHLTPMDIE
jgi:hypothetical protein